MLPPTPILNVDASPAGAALVARWLLRGSHRDRDVGEHRITHERMKLGRASRGVTGILSGTLTVTNAVTARAHLEEKLTAS